MTARKAVPVAMDVIQVAKSHLQSAIAKIDSALETMLRANVPEIEIRNYVTMTVGVKKIVAMASELRDKAEDAEISSQLGVPTKVQRNREHHAAYDKPKPAAKKKAKAPGKRTEGA